MNSNEKKHLDEKNASTDTCVLKKGCMGTVAGESHHQTPTLIANKLAFTVGIRWKYGSYRQQRHKRTYFIAPFIVYCPVISPGVLLPLCRGRQTQKSAQKPYL